MLQAERLILHTVGFDFNVEHPYKHILNLARELCKSDEKLEMHHRRATQVAWNFANDRCGNDTHNHSRHGDHLVSFNVAKCNVLQSAHNALSAVLSS